MRYCLALLLVILTGPAAAATGVDMLPNGGEHVDNIPKPVDILGFETGAGHARHDQLVGYFEALARASDRVRLEDIGRTYEGRRQLLAIISTPGNLAKLDEIREAHLAVARGEAPAGAAPVILWQGYSIHGNESSGSNAAMLYAWHLASSRDPAVTKMLDDVVVLVDPSLNPDGMARFAEWATQTRSESVVADPTHRAHHEHWPSGRGNHYWFDLNRDWLLLQHPESRHRVQVLNRWRPDVVTDHHEMGPDETYFFQPGVPERTNPLTSKLNQALTGRIAEYHAKALDKAGRLYFTRENYDDFYYGKGSTYPDITGGIGILFEQSTSAGQAISTPLGVKPFWRTVQDQLITSLSTLEATYGLRDELRDYQADFFKEARGHAGDGAWVVGDGGNPARMHDLLAVLAGHGIRFRPLEEDLTRDGTEFQSGHAWVVPENQFQSRLVQALFETRTEFPSHVFYDVSAWTLPLAFDLPWAHLRAVPDVGDWQNAPPALQSRFSPDPDAVAYVFGWHDDRAPMALQALEAAGIHAMAATRPFSIGGPGGTVAMERGAIVVPLGLQAKRREDIERILTRQASDNGLSVHAAASALTGEGIDLGSPSMVPLAPVRPLLVVGRGVSGYEAGEVWHMADRRLGLPVTQVDRGRLDSVDLHDYTHVILVGGNFDSVGDDLAARLHEWMLGGGVLITQKAAAKWATDQRLMLASRQAAESGERPDAAPGDAPAKAGDNAGRRERRDYADYPDDFAETLVSGTIFATDADTTHPLAFGLPDRSLPVFRNDTIFLPSSDNPYETVVQYTSSPLLAGYISDQRLKQVAGGAAVLANRVGKGLLVRFADDPDFRAFWHGTARLMVNALYLSGAVRGSELPQ